MRKDFELRTLKFSINYDSLLLKIHYAELALRDAEANVDLARWQLQKLKAQQETMIKDFQQLINQI